MGDPTPFATLLDRHMRERGYTLSRLAEKASRRLPGETRIHKQTVDYWRKRGSVTPYYRDYLIRVADALALRRVEAERLLRAAGLPPLDTLRRAATPKVLPLFARWDRRAPHNLPVAVTGFIGRADEVLDLGELLCQRDVCLVTLTGAGGSGKTRLSVQVATGLLDSFPDGIRFVDLAALVDPALVLPAIARTLGVGEAAGEPLAERLKAHLRERRLLLLLDNFEQVVAAAPRVTELLQAAPGLKVLVTSRVALRVYGEHERPVLPFAPPPVGAPLAELVAHPAVALFAARARAAAGDFALTHENAPAAAELCARLDGLPLAIELAAARSKRFTPQALLEHFPSRLDLGGDGPRDVAARQQTLRAAIGWSDELLDPDTRTLFARLAVFSGGWTAAAAAAVCGTVAAQPVDVPAALAALRASSLIGEVTEPGGESRYSMLETIREYAAERLAAGGEEAELRGRHAAYFLAQAEAAEPYVPGLWQGPWLDRMEREHDNLRAALAWALAEDTGEMAARLVGALWPFWHERLYINEGTRGLGAVGARGDRLPAGLRAPVLLGTLSLTFSAGDFSQCVALGEEALAAWQDRGEARGLALVRLYQALTRQNLGDVAAARAHYEESLAHWRAAGNPYGRILSLSHLAFMLAQYAQFAEADRYFDEARALAERHDDRANIARSYIDRGLAVMMQGRFAPARELLREGLARSRAQRHAPNTTAALTYLGLATLLDDDPAEAFGYLAEALRLRREAGDKFGMIYCLIGIAGVAGRQAQPVRAARLCAAATALQQATGAHIPPGPGALYERELRAVQAQLDEAAFAAAWAAGRAMSLEEVIAYGLDAAACPPT